MNSELVEKAAKVITDPPVLINLISKRIKQLQAGSPPLVKVMPRMSTADIALTEVIEGKIKAKLVEEQQAE
jgi:DNA-directed RNA polymerase subunit omega